MTPADIKQHWQFLERLMEQGELPRQRHDLQTLRDTLTASLEQPTTVDTFCALGRWHEKIGNYRASFYFFDLAVQRFPDQVAGYLGKIGVTLKMRSCSDADFEIKLRQSESAVHLERLCAKSPTITKYQRLQCDELLARIYLQPPDIDTDAAIAVYTRVIDQLKAHPELVDLDQLLLKSYFGRSELYIEANALDDAEADCKQLLTLTAEPHRHYYDSDTYRRLQRLRYEAYRCLGEIAHERAEFKQAIQYCKQAAATLAVINNTPNSKTELTALPRSQDDSEDLEKDLDRAVSYQDRKNLKTQLEITRQVHDAEIQQKNRELSKSNQELQEKNAALERTTGDLAQAKTELEDLMSMFSHKFRSPLDAILFNTQHSHDTELYRESCQTMSGLLDIFGLISTEDRYLRDKISQDVGGETPLLEVVHKTLFMTIYHLLSKSGQERITQHYLHYATRHGLAEAGISRGEWKQSDASHALHQVWEDEYLHLLNQTTGAIVQWIESRFFKINLVGLAQVTGGFRPYGVKYSVLVIVINECLMNAFKYSSAGQSLEIQWVDQTQLQFTNFSDVSERLLQKGSKKGHRFLKAIAQKIGGHFEAAPQVDRYHSRFTFPSGW